MNLRTAVRTLLEETTPVPDVWRLLYAAGSGVALARAARELIVEELMDEHLDETTVAALEVVATSHDRRLVTVAREEVGAVLTLRPDGLIADRCAGLVIVTGAGTC